MDAEGIERIVITQFALEQHRLEADDARKGADDDRGPGRNKTAGGCDRHEARDKTGRKSQRRRPAVLRAAMQQPATARKRGDLGGGESEAREGTPAACQTQTGQTTNPRSPAAKSVSTSEFGCSTCCG